jgi:LacI family transcriptional regulator
MSVGIKEIALACGLSNNSVSDILNRGRQHLYRPDTCKRVLEQAAAMNYRPNRSAQSMRAQHTRVVGFLACNMKENGRLHNYGVYPFLIGMSHYFTKLNYHVSLVEIEELEESADAPNSPAPNLLREKFLDGLIVHADVPDYQHEMLQDLEVPAIMWDAGVLAPYNCIYRDEPSVMRDLLARVLGFGHRRIAFMTGSAWESYKSGGPLHFSYKQRYETFVEVMSENGLEPLHLYGEDSESLASQLEAHQATAVICHGQYAQNLVSACARLGWSIPEQISIAGFDIETRMYAEAHPWSGMGYDRYDIGLKAAAMLYAKINAPNEHIPTQVFGSQFIDRHSIAAPRAL